jgi:hypothetical protein
MKQISWRYWLCQIVGWGVWCCFALYLNLVVYKDSFENMYGVDQNPINAAQQIDTAKSKFFIGLFINFICAILITHLLRYILKKINWLHYGFNNLVFTFLISAIAAGITFYFVTDVVEKKSKISLDTYKAELKLILANRIEKESGLDKITYYKNGTTEITKQQKATIEGIKKSTGWSRNANGNWIFTERSNLVFIYQTIILIALWLLIYFVWHYVERSRKDQLDRFKLESMVKELELKTIKAHINPHFIFNSLNSIRALVDENPQRARGAITELSNLLRSSMQAEKTETVTLEKEMKIVEDYLALEKIRFEDRLQVQMNIDEDTLDQQVPPMMVQTLVENAIKHGISKQVNGGTITIHSDFVNSHYELKVENTGTLHNQNNQDGFGLKSTQDRLKLLFGPNSSFGIKQETENTVAVTVALPVKINN